MKSMTINPPILLGISILSIVVGVILMPWLQAISLIPISIGVVVSIYAVAGLIGMVLRKKAAYLEFNVRDRKKLPGIFPLILAFFVFFASFNALSSKVPEEFVNPLFYAGVVGLLILGMVAFFVAKKNATGELNLLRDLGVVGKFVLITILFIIVIGIIIGGSSLWNEYQKEQIPSVQEEVRGREFKEWRVYQNAEYGFEVNYPTSLKMEIEPVTIVGGTNDGIGGSFGDIAGEVTAQSAPYPTTNILPALRFVVFPSVTDFPPIGDENNLEEYVKRLTDLRNRRDQIVEITSNATYERVPAYNTFGSKSKYSVYESYFATEVYFQNANDDVIRFSYADEMCIRYEKTVCIEKEENLLADQILSTFRFIQE